jgi:nucleoside-diphosphate-sugar epimerase
VTRVRQPARPLVSVLGASGFLGGTILNELVSRPVQIRAVSRRPALVPRSDRLTVLAADLREEAAVAAAVQGADAIILVIRHDTGEPTWRVAGDDSDAALVNSGVARTVARLCRAGLTASASTTVIFAGSVTQAGLYRRPLTGAEPDRPTTAYDRQKLDAEQALLMAARQGACRAVSLRLPTVFGPAPSPTAIDRGIVSTMARRALAGRELPLWGDGAIERDLLGAPAAAAAFIAALDAADRLNGRHWLVGSGHSTTLREMFDAIAQEVARRTGRHRVGVRVVPPPRYATELDLVSTHLDPTAFASVSGWSPSTDWRATLVETVASLVDRPLRRRG